MKVRLGLGLGVGLGLGLGVGLGLGLGFGAAYLGAHKAAHYGYTYHGYTRPQPLRQEDGFWRRGLRWA